MLVCKKDLPKRLVVPHSEWSQCLMTVEHRFHPHPRTGCTDGTETAGRCHGASTAHQQILVCVFIKMTVRIKPWRGIFAKDFNKGFIPRWVNCTYREKQNSSCFLKHSLMSSVDTVELPSPERDHIHHQLPLSWQQDQARTHLITEYQNKSLWVGPRGKKAHPRCLKTPRPHCLKITLIPLFGYMLRPYWSFLDMSELQFGHTTLGAAPGGLQTQTAAFELQHSPDTS